MKLYLHLVPLTQLRLVLQISELQACIISCSVVAEAALVAARYNAGPDNVSIPSLPRVRAICTPDATVPPAKVSEPMSSVYWGTCATSTNNYWSQATELTGTRIYIEAGPCCSWIHKKSVYIRR